MSPVVLKSAIINIRRSGQGNFPEFGPHHGECWLRVFRIVGHIIYSPGHGISSEVFMHRAKHRNRYVAGRSSLFHM